MEILVEPDRRMWEAAGAAAPHFWPLQQDWDYGLAVRWQMRPVLRLLACEGGVPVAALQLVGRRWFGIAQLWLALRGPVSLQANADIPPALVAAVPRGLLCASLLAPELPDSAATADHWQGRARVFTGHSCALIDLATYGKTRLHQKWRNRLAAATRAGLRVEFADRGKWIDWIIAQYDSVRRAKGFAGPGSDFVAQLARLKTPRQVLAAIALDGREPVAGALFLRHGPDASYYVAASSVRGRATNAANLVLYRSLLALKEAGVRCVDLGTIDTDKSPGLARFKLGAGARPMTLAGTYL